MAADEVRTLTGVLRIDFNVRKASIASGGKNYEVLAADYEAIKTLRKSTEVVEFDVRSSGAAQGQQIALNVRARAVVAVSVFKGASVPAKPAAGMKKPATAATQTPQIIAGATGESAPYHFVPVEVDAAITDAPVWHDGVGSASRISGELDCVLTALTPLIVGSYQYDLQHASAASGIEGPETKKVIEPLTLPDGRVVIADRSLKGMVRQSVAALVSSPMERVAERTFSFRPNLAGRGNRLDCEVAVVDSVGPPDEQGRMTALGLKCVGRVSAVFFVEKEAAKKLGARLGSKWRPGEIVPKNTSLEDVWLEENQFRKKLCARNVFHRDGTPRRTPWTTAEENYLICSYRTGIDGEGELLDVFNKSGERPRPTVLYTHMLVPQSMCGSVTPVSEKVLAHFNRTHSHLSDSDIGHLANHPLKEGIADVGRLKSRVRNTSFSEYQAVFVEIDLEQRKLTSVGPHYRYRNRYSSTVRTRWNTEDRSAVRSILSPLKGERLADPQRSQDPVSCLSAVRRLFGFVAAEATDTSRIAVDDFGRLAGRVAINCALETADSHARGASRFVDNGHAVPLKELGSPKPSAFEFYLRQDAAALAHASDGAELVSYGDTLDDAGGELAGRKFYLHQPRAATDDSLYREASPDAEKNKRSAYASQLLAAGAIFRFRVRFRDLDLWELGALVAVLEPERWLAWASPGKAPEQLLTIIGRIRAAANKTKQPPLALKLGHGRPLGLGSVAVRVEACKTIDWEGEPPRLIRSEERLNEAFVAFVGKLGLDQPEAPLLPIIKQWLKIQRFAGRTSFAYPTREDKNHNQSIYNFHTEARGDWSAKRRAKPGTTKSLSRYRLSDLDD